MIYIVVHFLPFLLCLFWLATFALKKKTFSQYIYIQVLAFGMAYFFGYGLYVIPQTDYLWMSFADVFSEPLALALLVTLIFFVYSFLGPIKLSPKGRALCYLPVYVFASILWPLSYTLGFEKIAQFMESYDQYVDFVGEYDAEIFRYYYFVTNNLFEFISGVVALIVVGICVYTCMETGYARGDLSKFLRGETRTIPVRTIVICVAIIMIMIAPIVIMGRTYMITHPSFGVFLSVGLSVFIYILSYLIFHHRSKNKQHRFRFR